MKPDVIVTWPDNCDYPLWREFIRENRSRFNKVIIGFMATNQKPSYKKFIIQSMIEDDITFFNAPLPSGDADWRNLAINKALQFVTSDWVWFTEQDFEVSPSFWHDVDLKLKHYDAVGIYQGNRLHPCCLFVKKEQIDKTKKNFGIVPNVSDHFSIFASDLSNNDVFVMQIKEGTYYHHNGLSSNFTLLTNCLTPNHQPLVFAEYMAKSLNASVPISDKYREIALRVFPQTMQELNN